jgi:DNA-directed RNA polymerase specialized sigma24 family protein
MPVVSAEYDEQVVVAGLLSGDKAAFGRLYASYAPALLGFILKITGDTAIAERILQQAFVAVWNNRESYDASHERLFTWMLRQTRQVTLQYLAKKQNNGSQQIPKQPFFVNMKGNSNGNGHLHKEVLALMYYNSYSLKDAASILNMSEDKLKSLLRSTVNRLKTLEE